MTQDQMIGALIGLARATDGNEHLISEASTALVAECLAAVDADAKVVAMFMDRIGEEKRRMVPDCFLCACPCGRTDAYDMTRLEKEEETVRDMKTRLLSGLRCLAAGPRDPKTDAFLYKGLIAVGMELTAAELAPILEEMGL